VNGRRRKGTGFSRKVAAFLKSARAVNTVRAYESDVRQFKAWGGRIPATPRSVAEYVAELSSTRTYATVVRRVAAISSAHRALGHPTPCLSEVVRSTMKGIRRTMKRSARQLKPLMSEQVVAAARLDDGSLRAARDRALLLLGFAGAFRRSELVAIDVEDCGMRAGHLVVTVRRSKGDQEAKGRDVIVPPGKGDMCPLRALRQWLRRAGIRDGAVFRRIESCGTGVSNARLAAGEVARVVKRRVERLGLDPREYAAHSLRAGFVTTAALKGYQAWQIRRQTGHSRESVVAGYIRPADLTLGSLL
jgi:integrase